MITMSSSTSVHRRLQNALQAMGLRKFYAVVIVVTTVLCYYNSLNCGFVFDDISAIKDNKDLRPTTSWRNLFLNDYWGSPMHKEISHKSYRPLTVFTFRLNYLVDKLNPVGYHLVNMVLHSLVSVLYYRVCGLFLPDLGSFVAGMLFGVQPIHTEAVTGVVGRAELLAALAFLSSLITFVKATGNKRTTDWWLVLVSMLLALVAMMCKEPGITVLGVSAIHEIFILQKLRYKDFVIVLQTALRGKGTLPPWFSTVTQRLSAIGLTLVTLVIGRLSINGSQLPVFTRFDNPASVAETPVKEMTFNYLVSLNAWLLLFPSNLCVDWTMQSVPLLESFQDPRNLATVGTYAVLGTLAFQGLFRKSDRHSNVIIMGLSLLVLPFLPASNLFFPVGFVIAERILYIPSMGFCLLVAYGWIRLYATNKGRRKWCWMCLAGLLAIHSIKTHMRNWEWESEYSVFMAGLRVNQRNAKLWNNVGHSLESQGKYAEALKYFQKAVSVQTDDMGAHINVGRTYNNLKMYKEAEEAYRKAKSLLPKVKPGESYEARIAPAHLNVFLNLANLISKNETRLEEADRLYREAISMRADYTQAYINRGDILLKMNRTEEALEVYGRALTHDNYNPDIYYNLGVVHLQLDKPRQALAYFDKALEIEPDHPQALLNSAIVWIETGDNNTVARERLLTLITREPANERALFHLGMLAMDEFVATEAEFYFRQAIQIKEDFRSALFNLALLLSDAGRPLESIQFLNQLIKFHPDHVKGLILLGDIHINTLKDLEVAESCYRRILYIDPENVQAVHNMGVIFYQKSDLLRAEEYFLRASHLAPHEDYIQKNLKIIRQRIAAVTDQKNSGQRSVMQKTEFQTKFVEEAQSGESRGSGENDLGYTAENNSNKDCAADGKLFH